MIDDENIGISFKFGNHLVFICIYILIIIFNIRVQYTCMPNISNLLTNAYLVIVFVGLAFAISTRYNSTDNYFALCLQLLDSPFTKLLLYNVVIAVAVLVYKVTIWLFYEQVKQNETLNLIQKIWYKLFELCYFLYVAGSGFSFQSFVSLSIVFMMFVFHNIAIARASFLIHTHISENMTMNYRLLAHLLIMIFVDYELSIHTFSWLFSQSTDSSFILFAYYCLIMSLALIEPALSFFLHFYEAYTNCPIEDSDINMMKLKFIINIPRLIVQLLLSILLTYQFSLSFILIFTLIESVNEIIKTFKSYNNMKGLIDKMKNLKELGHQELEKEHDRVCTVCFSDINHSALLLPCKHIFHKECLRQWIIKNSNHHCPKCKKPFDFENMKTQRFEEQIRKAKEEIREMNLQDERNDPLGFAGDTRKNNSVMRESSDGQSPKPNKKQNLDKKVLKLKDNNALIKLDKKKSKGRGSQTRESRVGSVPFGLPTEAVYNRRDRDMKERSKIIMVNNKMIKFMKMDPVKQLLFVPEFHQS